MRLTMGTLALGLLVLAGTARGEEATSPAAPAQATAPATAPASAPAPAAATTAGDLKAPENVHAEPSTAASAELSSRSATAGMKGNAQESLKLADRGIRANSKDPWPYYDKGMALARVGEINGALAALLAAEQHFAAGDRWGRSVAVFGRAHTLAEAGRCDEARAAFQEYMSLVRGDPEAVALASRYSRDCRPPAPPVAPAAK
jgi:tetratricopeptide (TPR) repeat protein